ncbi:MAG: 6-phosphogluconolactonase [Rhodospirillaceae bacterium]
MSDDQQVTLPAGPFESLVFDDREALAQGLAARVADDLIAAVEQRGQAVLAVPGGSTPGPFLQALGQRDDVPWAQVIVTLTDERWVPADHPRSNEKLLNDTFLAVGPACMARFLPLYAPAPSPEATCAYTGQALEKDGMPLDVLVLGMGEDSHTASLFPGADRLAEGLDTTGDAALLPMRAPDAPEPRLTLTAPALLSADRTYLLITGANKAAALVQALEPGPDEEAPIRLILTKAFRLAVAWSL